MTDESKNTCASTMPSTELCVPTCHEAQRSGAISIRQQRRRGVPATVQGDGRGAAGLTGLTSLDLSRCQKVTDFATVWR
jgi:hypothetical protein